LTKLEITSKNGSKFNYFLYGGMKAIVTLWFLFNSYFAAIIYVSWFLIFIRNGYVSLEEKLKLQFFIRGS
jgi:hypothetical protein